MHPAAATTAGSTHHPPRLPAHMGDACWLMSTQGPSFIKAEQVSFDLLACISNQASPLPSPASVHKLVLFLKREGEGLLIVDITAGDILEDFNFSDRLCSFVARE